jgi:hypothetical protein
MKKGASGFISLTDQSAASLLNLEVFMKYERKVTLHNHKRDKKIQIKKIQISLKLKKHNNILLYIVLSNLLRSYIVSLNCCLLCIKNNNG